MQQQARKKRKRKINWVDLLILLFLILILGWFVYNQFAKVVSPHTYPGTSIYTVIEDVKTAESEGFIVIAKVTGKWTVNSSEFKGGGVIAKTAPGRLYIIYGDRLLTVGGPSSYLEDVAADLIEIRGASSSVVKFKTRLISSKSISEVVSLLENVTSTLAGSYGLACYKFSGAIILRFEELKVNPYIYQMLIAKFDNAPLMGEVYFVMGEDYITAYVKNWRADELIFLERALDELKLEYSLVLTNRLNVYMGTIKPLSTVGGYRDLLANSGAIRNLILTDQIKIAPTFPV